MATNLFAVLLHSCLFTCAYAVKKNAEGKYISEENIIVLLIRISIHGLTCHFLYFLVYFSVLHRREG